ncbi:thioesterase II family protein [Streptomyces sp. NPDC058739]|jgi:surfactin synthase thioesterase subunit|uniref:thioesterase II family protein n=1 Tax=Streptomyces sp. NPDC058739 TaxID=3346618 RepID=UPI0036BE300C
MAPSGAWIRRYLPLDEPRQRLICFPHAGGSASYYRTLARSLGGTGTETLVVQYPGRQERIAEPAARDVDEILTGAWDELLSALGDGRPFGLFGHSMGTVLAFEAARRLEREGPPPDALFVSAREAPSAAQETDLAARLAEYDDEGLVTELQLLGGLAQELLAYPEMIRIALSWLRADISLLAGYTYRPGPPLRCPVVTLVGDADPHVPADSMRSWRTETDGAFETHVLDGGHFYFDAEERLAEVCKIVDAGLRR